MKWTTHADKFGKHTYTSGDWRIIHHVAANHREDSYYESYYDGHWIDGYETLAEAKRGVKRFMKNEQEAGRERLETLAIFNTLGER